MTFCRPARLLPRPLSLLVGLLLLLPTVLGGPREAEAGAPSLSDNYRDRVHKFSLRMFKDYKPVPLKTDETLTLCQFRDPKSKGEARGTYDPEIEVLKIVEGDAGPVTTGTDGGPPTPEKFRELFERLNAPKNAWDATVNRWRLTDDAKKELEGIKDKFKTIKSRDKPAIPGKLWQFTVTVQSWGDEGLPVHVTLAEFTREKESIILFMNCGGPLEKSYAPSFKTIAKSFKWFDDKAKEVETLAVLDGVNITPKKRRQIERGMVKGWDVVVSPKKNYIILYNTKDDRNHLLAKVIAKRIEMIREQVYEVQFPPAKPITTVCIVRVCGDAKEYKAYGGPGGSAGYWSSGDEELVFYDASASKKPDDDTLSVLYHEAFHQYIYYSVGNVAPHSWFNEGHGDYYAGAELKGSKFVIKPFRWRLGVIKNALVEGPRGCSEVEDDQGKMRKQWEAKGYTPLKDLVRFSQGEYYSYPSVCYAQGWSLIYFLREVVPNDKKLSAKYGKILDTYFAVLQREVNTDEPLRRGGEAKPGDKPDEGKPDDDGDDDEKDGPEKKGGESTPDEPKPDDGGTPPDGPKPDEPPPDVARIFFNGRGGPEALQKAVEEAFEGIDWDEFEKAWFAATKHV